MIGLDSATRHALQPLLRVQRLGVFTDIDGTISPIAPTPAAALVDPTCRAALARLRELEVCVAAVSGRAAADARAMLGLDGVVYIGNHGLERWANGVTAPVAQAVPYTAAIESALAQFTRYDLPAGVLIENKGVTASVHYRLVADPAAVAAQLGLWLVEICQNSGLRLHPGRMIYELRPPLALHKGTALADLLREEQLGGAIFLGDDTTDVDGFLALRYARNAGLATVTVGVLSAETPVLVRETCDVLVPGVAGVAVLLTWLAAEVASSRKIGSQGSGIGIQ